MTLPPFYSGLTIISHHFSLVNRFFEKILSFFAIFWGVRLCLERTTNGRPYRHGVDYNYARRAAPWCCRSFSREEQAPPLPSMVVSRILPFILHSTFYILHSAFRILHLIYRWHFAQRKAAFIERFSCFAQWAKICNKFLVNLPKKCAFFVDKASFIYYN